MSFKDSFIRECLNIFKKDELKHEIFLIMKPFIQHILKELYPYLFISLGFITIIFILIVLIFILIVHMRFFYKDPQLLSHNKL